RAAPGRETFRTSPPTLLTRAAPADRIRVWKRPPAPTPHSLAGGRAGTGTSSDRPGDAEFLPEGPPPPFGAPTLLRPLPRRPLPAPPPRPPAPARPRPGRGPLGVPRMPPPPPARGAWSRRPVLALPLLALLLAPPPAPAQMTPDQAAALTLDSARKAYNE